MRCSRWPLPVRFTQAAGCGPVRRMKLPRGFHVLIAAQFCSALADNALLIVAMAQLMALQLPGWWAPLLKFCFTIAYVVLAPGVGVLADRWPKARMMMAMNALKVVGVALLLAQGHPLLAMAVVGVGAAAYAPAKYGLVTELVGPRLLVAANGWIEVTTVCAVLLGTVLGGLLVSPLSVALAATWLPGQPATTLALWLLLVLYGLAALLNAWVPDSGATYRRTSGHPLALWRGHWRANRRLWADREGGLSMAVTTLFWGAAAVLQFAVLRWAGEVLGLPLDRAAYLQGAVAVGIVLGAALAGRWVTLARATEVLPLGVLLGLLVPAVVLVHHWWVAVPLLTLVGVLGGALVVPMNALLQHRGHELLSAGRSIAVQNFNENASVLVMLAVYAALLAAQWDVRTLMAGLGLGIALSVSGLWWWHRPWRRAIGTS
jgi:LPLT family lysophospholipid transporter-like MFS transporter